MMKYPVLLVQWLWGRKFFGFLTFISMLFFLLWTFPFSDLSDLVTTVVARGTNNQVYVQFETLNLHFVPQPAVSATQLSVETSLPPLTATWAKVTPSLFSTLFNLPSIIKASNGDPEAARSVSAKLGVSIRAKDLLGGDVSLSLGAGKKGERGERSRISLAVDKLNLAEVQKWSELSLKLQGRANLETDMQFAPDFAEQPEGEYKISIAKFAIPASTIIVPIGEANMPVNIPEITLANVVLRGRLVGGVLYIEEGVFGQGKDPLHGRIKGKIGLVLQPTGVSVVPTFNRYDLAVEFSTTKTIEKDIGFLFLPLGAAKTDVPGGGAKYVFNATGAGICMTCAPQITRLNSF
jgi:type II secretion system protein N